jgi:transposase
MRPKKSKRKRHVVTDTSGLRVGVVVHPADIQDRDGAGIVTQAVHYLFPWLRHLFADSVYNGPNLRETLAKFGDWTIEIVTRATGVTGFPSCRAAGLSSEPSPGSIETADWQRTSRPQSPAPQPGSTSLPHSFSSGDWWTHSTTCAILIQTLRG